MLEEAEAELRDAVAKRSSYEEELKSPLTQRLSDEELATLETLVPEVAEQKTELVSATSARQKVSRGDCAHM
jgi:structural maintenance of chromosome 3 (chondroitin sulfate proteoglycan 6)